MDEAPVITSPPTGERIRWLVTEADSAGELLRFDYHLAPGRYWPGARLRHVHPNQEERFHVVAGTPEFRVAGATRRPRVGDDVVVPAGTPHRFRNAGADELHCVIELRPALRTRQLFETLFALAADGRAGFGNAPRDPLLGAFVAHEFRDEIAVGASGPSRVALWIGKGLGAALGRSDRYRALVAT